jgi:hypothetical protein
MSQFTQKYTTESELFSFDFNPVLVTGQTISTATCTAITLQGTDPNPSAILSGVPVVVSEKTTQRVQSGVADNTYRLIMTVTNKPIINTYTCTGDIPVYSLRSNNGQGGLPTGRRL